MMVASPTMGSQLVEVISLCKQPNADKSQLAIRIKDFQEHSLDAVLGNNWIIHKDLLILKGGETSYLIQQSLAAKHSIQVITRLAADKFTAAYTTINKYQIQLQQDLKRVYSEGQTRINAAKEDLERSKRLVEIGKQNVSEGNAKIAEGLRLKQLGAENEKLAKQMAQISLEMFQTGTEELKAAEQKVAAGRAMCAKGQAMSATGKAMSAKGQAMSATGKAMVAEADKKLAAIDQKLSEYDDEEARLLAELAALDK